jgi:hypothetical protein
VRHAYTARVTAAGVTTTHLTRGTTAGAALTNLRRQFVGPWQRIEVGIGEGDRFQLLEVEER